MSVWMVQRAARHLTFLSRSAGSGEDDADFVRELESMGCTVQLVMVDVTKSEHVARAVHAVPTPLKGIVQMSMVLWDQMFDGMPIEDWKTVTQPKVQGTWNLQCRFCTTLLWPATSTSTSSFFLVPYRAPSQLWSSQLRQRQQLPRCLRALPRWLRATCTAIDLGTVKDVGYLSQKSNS
ncbi:hypothetical protein MCOR25_004871 [Pyricularia grisea]|nr:hypothetical protein MCOR25_004871 [Pyricularia grisea]